MEIRGGTALAGATVVDGSKNAALPLLAAACLKQQVELYRRGPLVAGVW